MLSTFDRYLIRRFLYVFAIFFASTMGLFVIIDAFTHADEFQVRGGGGADAGLMPLLTKVGMHYLYQSSIFFDLVAPFLAIISVMTVLTMLLSAWRTESDSCCRCPHISIDCPVHPRRAGHQRVARFESGIDHSSNCRETTDGAWEKWRNGRVNASLV